MMNHKLRAARAKKHWSMETAASKIGVSKTSIQRWENGEQKPHGTSLDLLCSAYEMTAEELGFTLCVEQPNTEVTQRGYHENANSAFPDDLRPQDLLTRREFLQGAHNTLAGSLTLPIYGSIHFLASTYHDATTQLSDEAIEHISATTSHYRMMQREGIAFADNALFIHISNIYQALECTPFDKTRRKLWKELAKAQLVARFGKHKVKKLVLAKIKTFNESAIASAQTSGDFDLLGAAIGHLAHLYLREEEDVFQAHILLDQARKYACRNEALMGWLSMVTAAVAAKMGNKDECLTAINDATSIAHTMQEQENDPFFTDFSIAGVNAFAGNCLINIGQYTNAQMRLAAVDTDIIVASRRAEVFYDLSQISLAMKDLDKVQDYAFKAIELGVAAKQEYIFLNCTELAQTIKQREPNNVVAQAIVDYIHSKQEMQL